MSALEIRDLRVRVGGTEIISGLSVTVRSGEVHAVMGPNGAGKSTLSAALMGKPGYEVVGGSVTLDGTDLLALPTWRRALAGLHLVMQYPTEVPGVMLDDAMAEALAARAGHAAPAGAAHAAAAGATGSAALRTRIDAEASRIGLDPALVHRAINVDFSGGEKKRNETLQLALLAPRIAVLDELDSGLDIDALRDCARRVEDATREAGLGVLVITHYSRLFADLRPDVVHVLVDGRIVETGGPEVADRLERDGYGAFVRS
jgi:Fe-S cluster assembly ATP-binding protein